MPAVQDHRWDILMRFPGFRHEHTLLMCRGASTARDPAFSAIAELAEPRGADEIMTDCLACGRSADAMRTEQRLRLGMRYFSLRRDGRVIAGTWAIRGGERFLDESMLAFDLDMQSASLRDVFVHPAHRGTGAFAELIDAVQSGPLRGIDGLWSFVDPRNAASIRAHERSGFGVRGWSWSWTAWDRVMWRGHRLPLELPCPEYRPDRRLLWLDADARHFRRTHLA